MALMKTFIVGITLIFSSLLNAQSIEGTEIGFDGFLSASTNGGSFGIGPKFGFRMNENFIFDFFMCFFVSKNLYFFFSRHFDA